MLIDYHPMAVGQIREIKEICGAEQPEFDGIHREVDRLLANRFISKADERGIERFEKELGIVPTPKQSLEERRIVVLIKAGKKNLSFKNVLNLMRNFAQELDLVPDYEKNELNVIIGETAENVGDVYDTLDDLIPLNILIYFTLIKVGYVRCSAVWQDDEVLELKEAVL